MSPPQAKLPFTAFSPIAGRAPVAGSQFSWRLALGVTCAVCIALLVYQSWRFGLNVPPAASGDEVDYDSIGWELSRGQGFQLNTGDAEFRAPYDRAAEQDPLFRLGPALLGKVTFRPPLFPVVLAVGDGLAGRQFWFARVINALSLAAVAGLLAGVLKSRGSCWLIVAMLILFLAVDFRPRLYSRAILTEATSALAVAVLGLQLFKLRECPSLPRVASLGLVFGLAMLDRSLFSLWLPGLCLMVAWLSFQGLRERSISAVLGRILIFLVVVSLVVSPWAVRNCMVLRKFYPLGTQGHSQLAAAFGDEIWERGGEWPNLVQLGVMDGLNVGNGSLLEQEIRTAEFSRDRARQWIKLNPGRTVALAFLKNWQELRPRSWPQAVLLGLALLGGITACRDPLIRIGWGMILINSVAIAATWSVEGRFQVPLLFVWHYFAAYGVWWLLQSLSGMADSPKKAA